MAEAVMSVVTLKYGNHRSWWRCEDTRLENVTAIFVLTDFKHKRMNT